MNMKEWEQFDPVKDTLRVSTYGELTSLQETLVDMSKECEVLALQDSVSPNICADLVVRLAECRRTHTLLASDRVNWKQVSEEYYANCGHIVRINNKLLSVMSYGFCHSPFNISREEVFRNES